MREGRIILKEGGVRSVIFGRCYFFFEFIEVIVGLGWRGEGLE